MIKAIYPGTFDPITFGHMDIMKRAANLFDQVIFAITENTSKKVMFNIHERLTLAKKALAELKNVEVMPFNGLVMDFALKQKANIIVRGLRTISDVDHELQMVSMNRQLTANIETIFLTPDTNLSFISSSLVKEIAALKGDVSSFVPDIVIAALREKLI